MTSRTILRQQLIHGVTALHLLLSSDVLERLLDYQALLLRWNKAYNLTAVRDPVQMVSHHLLDSLAILPFVTGQSLADLGTGAGLPGMVLAIADPKRQVFLVDSNGKKIRFLREVIRTLQLDTVHVVQSRVEHLDSSFDCITARAFASLADMLKWGGHLLSPNGVWLALKGPRLVEELNVLPSGFAVRGRHVLTVPGIHAQRHLVALKHDAI